MNRKTAISLFILILLSAFAAAFAADKTADSKLKFSTLKGTVKNTAQQPVEAAVVKLIDTEKGAVMSAKTGKDGSYVFEKAAAGRRYFIETEKTKDNMYLAGGLRKSFTADMKMQMIQDIEVSARPGEKADYVGTTVCLSCHMESSHDLTAGFMASAHQRVVHMGQDDIIEPAGGWGADNDPMGKKTGVMASPPDGSDSSPVTVTACTKDGVKGFAFGGAENEPCRTGVFIPIAATVGGQGDKYVAPGTDKPAANVGVFKQHFFAFLKNVPATSGPNWEMYPYPGAEQDFIMLPLYIAQSGNIAPNFVPFRAIRTGSASGGKKDDVQSFRAAGSGNVRDAWVDQGQQWSQACAACHVVGLKLKTGGKKAVYVSEFSYIELGMGCENCHGPGSDHVNDPGKAKGIIEPSKLTAKAEREICARCHGSALPYSSSPDSSLLYPWNDKFADKIGGGNFIAGIYDLKDFMPRWINGKGFFSWDGVHGRHHKQQSYEFEMSVHAKNGTEQLTCTSCHSAHSLYQGPSATKDNDGKGNVYNFAETKFNNNTVCFRCHSEGNGFEGLTKDDIALLNAGYGQAVYMNGGEKPLYDAKAGDAELKKKIAAAQNKVAKAVVKHMDDKAGMGLALAYTPLDDARPVGRCQSCHMPKTGLMGGYTWDDRNGERALVSGDVTSHVGDIIYPSDVNSMYQDAMKKQGQPNLWRSVMPTSCGSCHISGRYYFKK